jgi:hypothetical protein
VAATQDQLRSSRKHALRGPFETSKAQRSAKLKGSRSPQKRSKLAAAGGTGDRPTARRAVIFFKDFGINDPSPKSHKKDIPSLSADERDGDRARGASALRTACTTDYQEINMNASLRTSMALVLMAIPLFALPALGAAGHEVMPNRADHRVHEVGWKPALPRFADFAKAQALVSSSSPAPSVSETDGLSRNIEECNMGCIDNH